MNYEFRKRRRNSFVLLYDYAGGWRIMRRCYDSVKVKIYRSERDRRVRDRALCRSVMIVAMVAAMVAAMVRVAVVMYVT